MDNTEKIKIIQQRIDLLNISISHLNSTDPEHVECFESFPEEKKEEIYQFIIDQKLKIKALEEQLRLY
jgi:hypothetical protein